MRHTADIPVVDGAALCGPPGRDRDAVDRLVERACHETGFMAVVPPPGAACLDAARRDLLLSVFDLSPSAKQRLYRQRFVQANPNRYRGLAPMKPDAGIGTENLDVGPDVVSADRLGDARDVLQEASALPDEAALPGWRDEAARTFAGFEALGRCVVAAIERVLQVEAGQLTRHFERGNSTLTLARHPEPGEWDEALCARLAVEGSSGAAASMQLVLPHTDSGCVTFVNQDAGAGLEARTAEGDWTPVPHGPGWLAVNFGKLLQLWTGGAVRATEHRVVGTARRRTSIPFFFEPAVDARIEPVLSAHPFEPFVYGDWMWQRMQKFPDYQDLGGRFLDVAPNRA